MIDSQPELSELGIQGEAVPFVRQWLNLFEKKNQVNSCKPFKNQRRGYGMAMRGGGGHYS